MDIYSKEKRSEIMSRIKAKDTKPELRVRRLLHGLGYRYRLHAKELPGKPETLSYQIRLAGAIGADVRHAGSG